MRLFRRAQLFLADSLARYVAFEAREGGQTLVEYGLIIGVVILVTFATVGAVGANLKHFFYDQVAAKVHS